MGRTLIEAALVLAAVAAVALSPFGRRMRTEVGRDGLMFGNARFMGHVMVAIALLVVVAAALNLR